MSQEALCLRCRVCGKALSPWWLHLECPSLRPSGTNYPLGPRALRTVWQGDFPTVPVVSEAQFQFIAVEWRWGRLWPSCLSNKPGDLCALCLSQERGFRAPGGRMHLASLHFVSLHHPPPPTPDFWAPPSCSAFALKPFGAAGAEATQSFCEQLWLHGSHWPEQRRFSVIYPEHGWPWSLRIVQFLTVWGWKLLSSFPACRLKPFCKASGFCWFTARARACVCAHRHTYTQTHTL